ncbi:MAG TPA: hypothetical protein VNW29_02155 [Candidatus Sulfotelmatobacter sp.]|jgi:hypothetical protein|nr:hypothetical protein [Candidatus Sulfotelmatobacter sp.]
MFTKMLAALQTKYKSSDTQKRKHQALMADPDKFIEPESNKSKYDQ